MTVRIDPRASPGFLVGRVAHELKLKVQAFLDADGIAQSAEEISILTVLAHLQRPHRMRPLGRLLGRDPTTVSRQVASLERAGLVRRSSSPGDRRAVQVDLTRRGALLVERTMPRTLALRRQALQGLANEDRETLVRSLQRMLHNLRAQE